jgi:predicted MFS family arabinose efflux permease
VNAPAWRATWAATALMGLTLGSRSAFGLFVSPLNSATGIGMAAIGLAVAVGQLALGAGQPAVAALAERHGAARVMAAGATLAAGGTALVGFTHDGWTLAIVLLVLALASSAVGSNALLMGEVGRRVPPSLQGLATGLIGAGGSVGQLVLGPLTQRLIGGWGWHAALWATAALMLLALPLSRVFARPPEASGAEQRVAAAPVRDALRDGRFRLIAGGFAMCGFHVAFLSTHMPGVIERCGLPASLAGTWLAVAGGANIVGSIGIGFLMRRWSSPSLLAVLYVTRAASVGLLLAGPASAPAMLAFAAVMGLTYLAPLAPTAQLVSQHFGVQRLGTLFGVVMVAHQAGGFAGAWLGGLAVELSGSFTPLWIADLLLAVVAALLQWPLYRAAPATAIRHADAHPISDVPGSRAAPRAAGPARSACAALHARRAA